MEMVIEDLFYSSTPFDVVCVEFGSLTTAQLMEKVKGLQNLAYQLGLEEGYIVVHV